MKKNEKNEKLEPIHPGVILNEEFLHPLKISQTKLASDLSIPHRRVNEIVLGKRSISAETALLLAKYFGNSPQFWLNLQVHYDLEVKTEEMEEKLKRVRKIAVNQ